jgi:hypothetical protein
MYRPIGLALVLLCHSPKVEACSTCGQCDADHGIYNPISDINAKPSFFERQAPLDDSAFLQKCAETPPKKASEEKPKKDTPKAKKNPAPKGP